MTGLTVVIAAHNRPDALAGLVDSLQRADIPVDTELVLSIDGGGSRQPEVRRVADTIEWPNPIQVIEHDRIGLVEHFYRCGDLTVERGNVVFLEDDLIVAPAFLRWAGAALAHGESDDRIAGVSLAAPWFDGYRQLPFEPLIDGSDGLYAQVPWYDGMAWTPAMWQHFRSWAPDPKVPVHQSLDTLGPDEWFPSAMRYLVATNRWYLLPRDAQATNSGAAGAHFEQRTDFFQVPLALRGPNTWRLLGIDDSLAVYDDHMELGEPALRRLLPDLVTGTVVSDLLGVRDLDHVNADFVLTTRTAASPIRSWGASMHPLIANVIYDVPGDAINLARSEDVRADSNSETASLATLKLHATRGRTAGLKDGVRTLAIDITRKLRRG